MYALDPALEINAADAVAIVNAPQQPDDGDIVVAGTRSDPTALDPLVPSLIFVKSNGSLDTNFGIGGIVESTTNLLQDSPHVAVAVQSGGGIVVGGTAVTGTNGQPTPTAFVERFNSNGTPDSSFGVLGLAVPFFGGSSSSLGGLALDGGGNIVVAGTEAEIATASVPLVAVARLNEHGTPRFVIWLGWDRDRRSFWNQSKYRGRRNGNRPFTRHRGRRDGPASHRCGFAKLPQLFCHAFRNRRRPRSLIQRRSGRSGRLPAIGAGGREPSLPSSASGLMARCCLRARSTIHRIVRRIRRSAWPG